MPNYDLEKFAKVTESLDDLQLELEKPTARDVVDAAYDKIQEQVNKGIPHKQILRRYQEAGLKLSLGLFRQ